MGGTAALRPAGSARPADGPPRDLPALQSQALLAYTAEFERASPLPLPIIRNALRVVSESGVRVRDLPGLAGVAREAIAVFLRELESRGYVVIGPGPARPGWRGSPPRAAPPRTPPVTWPAGSTRSGRNGSARTSSASSPARRRTSGPPTA